MKIKENSRPAFTLVELLVAAGIIAMLLALVAISYPSINEREQLTRAVDKLRTGLLTARLWARRDNVVTGVRFEQDTTNSKWGYLFTQQPMQIYSGYVTNYDSLINKRLISIQFDNDSIARGANLSKIKPVESSLYYSDPIGIALWPTSPATFLLPDSDPAFFNYKNRIKPLNERHDSIILEGDVPHRIVKPSIPTGTSGELILESTINMNVQFKHLFRIIRNIEDIPLQEFNDFDSSIENLSITDSSGTPIMGLQQICFLPNGQVLNSPANQLILKLTQRQLTPPPNDTVEAEVKLDCISGTTRYTNP